MRFRRRLQPNARPDLVPMIDVVFQLVVFFMVSSTFVVTPGLNLDLPTASSAEPVAMTNVVISVVSEDEVYVNRERFRIDQLNEAISDFVVDDQLASVVIEGDSNARYDLMIRVLDILRQNGLRAASLRTREAD
ncbi:MAG: biopolymer transporter ExbD [Spirochaetaceae bacterium]|nr:MAG: biopolymer transporter ExbD [Spirochaetaceae bacterium]